MTQHVIAEPFTGLGNRLRCLASLMRIARRIDADFTFSWPVNADFAAPFEDLYDEPLGRPRHGPSDSARGNSSLLPVDSTLLLERGCNVRVITADHLQYPTIRARAAYFYLLETHPGRPEPMAGAMREAGEILAGFRLNPDVAERLDEASRELDIERRVGVHVRRGDVPSNRRVELPQYFETIAERYAAAPLFVASDDQRVVGAFEERFGSRVAAYAARSRRRTDRIAAQDALIDMLLLSRTRLIVTGLSSFTEAATMIGQNRRHLLRPE